MGLGWYFRARSLAKETRLGKAEEVVAGTLFTMMVGICGMVPPPMCLFAITMLILFSYISYGSPCIDMTFYTMCYCVCGMFCVLFFYRG
jgi:hypothetical protein